MAKNVETTINIKAKMDVSDVDKGTKQIQNDIDKLNSNNEKPFEEASKGTNDFSNSLSQLMKNLGVSNKELGGITKAFEGMSSGAGAAGLAITGLISISKIAMENMNEAQKALTEFGKGLLEFGAEGTVELIKNTVDFTIDGIKELVDLMGSAMDELKEFADLGSEIQRNYFSTFTKLGSESGNNIITFTENLEKLYGLDGTSILNDMQGIVTAAADLGVSSGDMEIATENMTLMANDLSVIAGDFKKASDDIASAVSMGRISKTSSLYLLMSKQEKEALASLGTEVERYNYLMSISERIKGRYVDFLGTEAGQLMVLNNTYGALQSNIQALALGLYAKIAPVLTKLINLANIALTYIMKVFNIDLKSSADVGTGSIADDIAAGMKKAGEATKKSSKDIKKANKESAKSVKELEKQVASFDDVIQLNNKKDDSLLNIGDTDDLTDGLDGLNAGISNIDLSKLYGLNDALQDTEDEFEEFKKLLDMGMYNSAGNWLANWLADKLEAIPWADIQDKARKTGKAIADFLNGLNGNKRLWEDIGSTIAEGVNTAFDFLLSFGKNFDFKELGDSLGVAWNKFWETFDTEDAAEALYEWFMGIFELLGSFFANKPLTNMTRNIALLMHSFFNNFTEEDKDQMAETIKNILSDVFTSAMILLNETKKDAPKIVEFFQNIISSANEWFNSGGGKEALNSIINSIAETALTLLNGLADSTPEIIQFIEGILDTIEEWMNSDGGKETLNKIGDAIIKIFQELKDSGIIGRIGSIVREIITNLKLGDIIWEIAETEMQIKGQAFLTKVMLFFQKLWAFIKDTFGTGLVIIKDMSAILFLSVYEPLKEIIDFIVEIVSQISSSLNDLKETFALVGEAIEEGVLNWCENVTEAFNLLKERIGEKIEWLKGKKDKVVQGFKDTKDGIVKAFEDIKTKLEQIWTSIWNTIEGVVNKIKTKISEIKDSALNGSWLGNITGKFGVTLPWSGKNAMGGITNGASIGMIGEAGREAILPLENNTGWMDALAEKINGKQGDGSPVVIDISKATKPVYTRAEYLSLAEIFAESMKARGVAVTYNY